MLHIVGCGRARGIQWYQNHIHWTKYMEVINVNANNAVYSTRTDYTCSTITCTCMYIYTMYMYYIHVL